VLSHHGLVHKAGAVDPLLQVRRAINCAPINAYPSGTFLRPFGVMPTCMAVSSVWTGREWRRHSQSAHAASAVTDPICSVPKPGLRACADRGWRMRSAER
jgi:hypothetical protein